MARPVALSDHDPRWAARAAVWVQRIGAAAPGAFVALHHIGSTAVPGLAAKPVIDLLGEVADLAAMAATRPALEGLGWRWRGENGLAGRRYLTWDDPETGARGTHLHVHAADDPALARRLAFRDRLRADPAVAAWEAEKRRCAALHPDDSGPYAACKKAWTDGVAAEAVGVEAGRIGQPTALKPAKRILHTQ